MTTERKQPIITVQDPNDKDVDRKAFKFLGIKELRGKHRRAERIISIDDPDNPDDEPTHYLLTALTGGEERSLHQNVLSQDAIQALTSEFVEKTQDGEQLDVEAATTLILNKFSETQSNAENERYLRKIQIGIRKPKVSLEWLRDLNPALLELFDDTLEDLRIQQELWIVENLIKKGEPETE